MHEVHHFSTDQRLGDLARLAASEDSPDNSAQMSEQKTSPRTDANTSDVGPLLRLAGTPAGEPTDAEKRVLELRSNAVLILGSLRRDSRMLCERLERAGRTDPVQQITGTSSLDAAASGTEEIIQNLDELLLEVGEPVEANS